MNAADIFLTAALLLALALAIRKCRKDRKNGKTCGGDCSRCGQACGK